MRRTLRSYLPIASVSMLRPDSRIGINRAQTVIARSILWISFIFMIFPAIDLVVSRRFAEGAVFVLAEQPFLKDLREFSIKGPVYIIIAMLLLISLRILLPKRYGFCAPHKPMFVLLSFVAGPGIIVETLKPLIGRARPRDLLEFGGNADFTPVWQFSAECARNCSFPSGEASGAAAALSLLVLVPKKLRWLATFFLVPVLMLIGFNRILFGAHFLSDVVLAWLLTTLAMAWIWRFLGR